MNRLLHFLWLSVDVLVVVVAATGQPAAGCDLCRRLGTTAYHVASIGGDDQNNALVPQPDGTDENPGVAQPAFAVVGGWPQPGGRGSLITLTYSYQNMFDGALKMPSGIRLPNSIIRQSIETALGLWAEVVPINFVEVPDDGREYFQGASKYGQLRFRHIYINGMDIPGQPPTTKAQAYYPTSGEPYAGDVEFDDGDPWQVVGTLPADLLGAATHEIGHTIGLGHTDNPEANMYWIFRRTKGLDDGWLHPDDVAGAQSMYGAGVGSVTPLAVPEPGALAMILSALVAAAKLTGDRRVARRSRSQGSRPIAPL